mgnify:CR=1 FL=1|tara:strand:- start:14572 stop:14877 length:306 start_codon:yes stop_codon:yes gene_type:complete
MQVHIKTPAEIDFMRESGKLLSSVFLMLDDFVKEGISTLEINIQVEHFIRETLHARPANLAQYGYDFLLNSSVNEVVCHGVPSDSQKLKANARRAASTTLR